MAKITATELDIIRTLKEKERGEEVLEVKERPKCYVLRFADSRPYVVPKEVES